MQKKLVTVIAIALMLSMVFSMTACSNRAAAPSDAPVAPSDAPATPSDAPAEDVTLRFMWWGSDSRHEATLAVIEQYEDLHPNVKIEAEYGGFDGYTEKLTTQLAGGTAPDIIQYNANTISDLMAIGDVFADLSTLKELDTSDFDQEFLNSFSYYNGKFIALPTGVNSGIWLVNTALLDEAGIDYTQIKTWDDFIAAGKALHEFNENYYLFNLDIDTLGKELLGSIMEQITGKDMLDYDSMSLNFTAEDLTRAFQLYSDMYTNNVLEPAADSAPYALQIATNPKWINHELACVYAATSNVYDGYYDFAETAVAMEMPMFEDAKESGILYVPPQMIAINADCKYPEVAADFLNYFYNDPIAIETLKTCRSIQPTNQGRTICAEKGYGDPVLAEAIALGGKSCTEHQNLYTPAEIYEILYDATEKIAYAQDSVENIVAETMSLLEDTLDRLRQ